MSRLLIVVSALIVVVAAVAAWFPLAVINGLTPTNTYKANANISYGYDPRLKLDVYQPNPSRNAHPPPGGYPVVLFFYGGSWTDGERADYRFVGEALAARGILTMVADYRLYPQVRYPDFLADCAGAVAWAKLEAPHYGGNTNRLYVMGHSAGAYNAAMLALDKRWLVAAGLAPSALAGWIGLAGPYDFLPIENLKARPVFNHPDYPPGTQPIDYAPKAAPRTFLGAAVDDDVVNPERNTRQLAQKLGAAGVPVTLKTYARTNHITLIGAFARPLRWLAPVLEDVVAFVQAEPATQ